MTETGQRHWVARPMGGLSPWWEVIKEEGGQPEILMALVSEDEARLCAAAPALYEALDAIVESPHHSLDGLWHMKRARALAALATARGEVAP
jgi:hypothetical protein